MRRPKQDAGHDFDEAGLFSDEQFQAGEFIDGMEEDGATAKRVDDRPARQRVELRREEEWLRRQLSDWDDFDDIGVEADDNYQDDFEPRI
jgi:hypothetical protein